MDTVDADDAAFGTDAAPPDRIADRYEIQGLLGTGGMGSVYRVRDLELGEVVALKFLRRDRLADPVALETFRAEVRLARRVTHVNVARTYDIGEHDGERFLTMEYVDGEPLARRLGREGPLPPRAAFDIGRAVCAGLAAAHDAGVVHRDVKPDNVLLARSGRVVVTDFGIAWTGAGAGSQRIVGTPAYMAPEQLDGGPVDARADLYALGALLLEALTGRPPWTGESFAAIVRARRGAPAPELVGLPPPIAEVLTRCLARRPDDRFPDARALAAALGDPGTDGRAAERTAKARALQVAPAPADGARTVAVMTFRNEGPAEDDWLAGEVADALSDALCAAPALRVRPRSVLALHAPTADARTVGRAVGVEVVVEGSIRRAGDRVRLAARLVSVADGFQLWARRLERPAAEVLDLTAAAAEAVASALASEVAPRAGPPATDRDAVDLYLRARQELRRTWAGSGDPGRAVELFEAALARLGDDPDVLAGLAMARARWFNYAGAGAAGPAGQILALAERAVERAPHLGEPWLALATIRFVTSEWPQAVVALRRALVRAPGLVRAHDMLGHLELEVGRAEEALFRLETALALDPAGFSARVELARGSALLGAWARCDALLALPVETTEQRAIRAYARYRLDQWRGGGRYEPEVRVIEPDHSVGGRLEKAIRRGRLLPEDLADVEARIAATEPGSRYRVALRQFSAEAHVCVGDPAGALVAVGRAVDEGLYDLLWLDRCTLLAPLRGDPAWTPLRERVVDRVGPVLAALDAPLPASG